MKTGLHTAILIPLLLVSMVACNRRGRECKAVDAVFAEEDLAAPLVLGDAGGGLSFHARTQRVIDDLDAIGIRDRELAQRIASYQAIQRRRLQAELTMEKELDLLLALWRTGAGAVTPPDANEVTRHVQVVAQPAVECLFASTPDASAATAECAAFADLLARAWKPAPDATIGPHLLACATLLDGLPVRDPAVRDSARALASLLRAMEPAVRGSPMLASDVIARAQRLGTAAAEQMRATNMARDGAKETRAFCESDGRAPQ